MKRLLTLVFATLSFASVASAKFYIGIEGGYLGQTVTSAYPDKGGFRTISAGTLGDIIKGSTAYYGRGFAVAGILGQEANFGVLGLRWGLGLGYSSVDFDDGSSWKQEVFSTEVSFDMILNLVNKGSFSLGLFGGIGTQYQLALNSYSRLDNVHTLGFDGRVGLTTLLARHHRVEVYAKLPFAQVTKQWHEGDKQSLGGGAKSFIGAGYKYVF
ncbi:outer membrane beta-barrel protein [Helicobacter cholecystus]|uniref:Outer membrane beta-barrel protein n=1 Tax=Helicobacter cholecystus TaxID=45498 RepID=A0A3D8IZL4_9HELI|nr:outer membrane beta-barrel protein [Helicobacter cholecystus]RDU69991.1 outer membrane beta-barrel protein [Helicobacter cholecystus]VEJ24839.1 outer membrane protein [Helicobacter cholecystus]